jgi:hypothetical protein
MSKFLTRVLTALRRVWDREPARVITLLTAAVVFVCADLGIVVSAQSVGASLAYALPILLGGEVVRSQVTPVAKLAPIVNVPPPAP